MYAMKLKACTTVQCRVINGGQCVRQRWGGDENIYLLLWVRKSGQNGSLKQRRLVSKVASLVKKLTKLLPNGAFSESRVLRLKLF